jgi:hypothetical protein
MAVKARVLKVCRLKAIEINNFLNVASAKETKFDGYS